MNKKEKKELDLEILKLTESEKIEYSKYELDLKNLKAYVSTRNYCEGRSNITRLVVEIGYSLRTARNYIAGYKLEGMSYFAHGNKGNKCQNKIPDEIQEKIVDLYVEKYIGTSYAQYLEIIAIDLDIKISITSLISILRKSFILTPRTTITTRRKTIKRFNELKKREKNGEKCVNIPKHATALSLKDAHPTRPRKSKFGELIQADACERVWFGTEKLHLHIAVDDCTGALVGAYFDTQETLKGYYNMTKQMLDEYGVPLIILTDKRTVFEYKRKSDTSIAEKDTYTQYAYMCKTLGVELRTTSVAQAKGRVERMGQTLQGRLPTEFKRASITTMEAANEFLKEYIPKFNQKFAAPINSHDSVFVPIEPEQTEMSLSVLSERVIGNGSSILYEKKRYIPINKNGTHIYFNKKTRGLVAKTLTNKLFFTVYDETYALKEIPLHEPADQPTAFKFKEQKEHKTYIPAANHPWRNSQFSDFRDFIAKKNKYKAYN